MLIKSEIKKNAKSYFQQSQPYKFKNITNSRCKNYRDINCLFLNMSNRLRMFYVEKRTLITILKRKISIDILQRNLIQVEVIL